MFTLEESALLAKLLRFVGWVLVFLIAGVVAAWIRRAW
jgi:hypothetical protein